MSGAARQRGRGRVGGDETSDTSSRQGVPPGAQSPRAPGGFDGPASRGSASGAGSRGAGSQGRRPSNPPSVGSGARSPAQSQSSFQTLQVPQQQRVTGDPARDQGSQPKLTDALRNLDLPASFYNIDQSVRLLDLFSLRGDSNLLHEYHLILPHLLTRSRQDFGTF